MTIGINLIELPLIMINRPVLEQKVTERSGNATFSAVYVEEYPKMVALAAAVCGNRVWAEDIAQEAFIKLDKAWEKVGQYDKPGAWLRRVTLNLAISRKRRLALEASVTLKMKRSRRHLEPIPDQDETIWVAVKKLPPKQRAVVALRYLEDRSLEEIGSILEISPSTARTHLQRAHKSLNDNLGGEHNE